MTVNWVPIAGCLFVFEAGALWMRDLDRMPIRGGWQLAMSVALNVLGCYLVLNY